MTLLVTTPIHEVVLVQVQHHTDERGWFGRTYDKEVFAASGIEWTIAEENVSFNARRGTLRGLHYQADPQAQPKLVRCTRGRVFDVAVDLRPASPTYCRWVSVELSADESNALCVPPGCAHGFLTLDDATEVFYSMGAPYAADLGRGVRWDDRAFGIEWPLTPTVMSSRDRDYPDFTP